MSRTAAAALALLVGVLGVAPAAAPPPERARPANPGVPPAGAQAPPEFVALRAVAPTVRQEIRYTGPHNFVGEPLPGYREPECLLTRDTARALARVQRAVRARGLTLKVYDCYRPQRAVDRFVSWAADPADERMKAEFYPRVAKDRLLADGYVAERSGHSRGSTVDLTLVPLSAAPVPPYRPGEPLVPCHAPQGERFRDDSVDMGTGYDCFDVLSHTASRQVGPAARANRLLLKRAMERAGFVNLPEEWWHYALRPEAFPDRHFDFPVARGALTAPDLRRPGPGRDG